MNDRDDFEKIHLQAPDGASAEVCRYGAHLTSWKPAGRSEQLFLSPRAEFRRGVSIRGGVPIIFPQFAELGSLPKHGLLRTVTWNYVEATQDAVGKRAGVRLRVRDDAQARALWPYSFSAEFHIEIGGGTLSMTLSVRNTDAAAFQFTAALHSYLQVDDVSRVSVSGLRGLEYVDKVAGQSVHGVERNSQPEEALRIVGEVDRIYLRASRPIVLADEARMLEIHKAGFDDVVVWNPGPALSAQLKDLGPEGYRTMLCIEAAAIAVPLVLEPGAEWRGSQVLQLRSLT